MCISKPLVPEPSSFESEVAIRKLECYKSPTIDRIPVDLIQPVSIVLSAEICKLNKSVCNLPFYKRDKNLTVIIIEPYHFYQLYAKCYSILFSKC
jgi:hypothetical protein